MGHRRTRRGAWGGHSGSAPPRDLRGLPSPAFLSPTSSEEPPLEEGQDTPIYTEFDEDFEESASPIGHCVAIYHFEGEHQSLGWRAAG